MMLRHKTVDEIVEFLKAKITKEINIKPALIPVIERINMEAEIFFLKELGNLTSRAHRHSQRRRAQEEEHKTTPADEGLQVKVEDEGVSYQVAQVK